MERLRLGFDTEILGTPRNYVVEVPYQQGNVVTSEYCPTSLLSGPVDLMAAIRGESLDSFMAHCRMQLFAMSRISEADTELDRHIGALMAVVMDHFSRHDRMDFSDLLTYIDCFSLLLKGAGFEDTEIRSIYPRVVRTIVGLYPDHTEGIPIAILQEIAAPADEE